MSSFLTDLKQRFIKFETLHGLYFVPLGIVLILVSLFHIEFIFQSLGALVGVYAIIEGLRKIFYNPVKKEALKVVNREAYIVNKGLSVGVNTAPGAPPAVVVSNPPSVNDASISK